MFFFSLIFAIMTLFQTGVGNQNPCPGIFKYSFDNTQKLFGTIYAPIPKNFGNAIRLDVEFTVGNTVEGFIGEIRLMKSHPETLQNILLRKPISYKLEFPNWNSIYPHISKIFVNGKQICAGDPITEKEAKIISTIMLKYTIDVTLPSNANFQYGNFNNPPAAPTQQPDVTFPSNGNVPYGNFNNRPAAPTQQPATLAPPSAPDVVDLQNVYFFEPPKSNGLGSQSQNGPETRFQQAVPSFFQLPNSPPQNIFQKPSMSEAFQPPKSYNQIFFQQPSTPEAFQQPNPTQNSFFQQPSTPAALQSTTSPPQKNFFQEPFNPEVFFQQPSTPAALQSTTSAPQKNIFQRPFNPEAFFQQPSTSAASQSTTSAPQKNIFQQPFNPEAIFQQPSIPTALQSTTSAPQKNIFQQPFNPEAIFQQPSIPTALQSTTSAPQKNIFQQPFNPEALFQQPSTPAVLQSTTPSPQPNVFQTPFNPEVYFQQPSTPTALPTRTSPPQQNVFQEPFNPEVFFQQPSIPSALQSTTSPPQKTSTQDTFISDRNSEANITDFLASHYELCGVVDNTLSLVAHGDTVRTADFPWVAAIFRASETESTFICGSTLITQRYAVSAAHCASNVRPTRLYVILGRENIYNWLSDGVQIQVSDTHIHPDYVTKQGDGDIALLKLKEKVTLSSSVRPICLWKYTDDVRAVVGQNGIVVGWGKDENQNYTARARKSTLPIVSIEECLRSNPGYRFITSNRTFCAGFRNNTGPCNGDSGSGLFLQQNGKWMLRGIVSLSLIANDVCDLKNFIVFVDTAKFTNWILSYIINY